MNNPIPILSVPDFFTPKNRQELIDIVIKNKNLEKSPDNISFPIIEDPSKQFTELYKKFYKLCDEYYTFTKSPESSEKVFAYCSDKENCAASWHNHMESSTINAVYYLNIPGETSIDFQFNESELTYSPIQDELIIFPNYLEHKPNKCTGEGYRISINMEIICEESPNEIFFP